MYYGARFYDGALGRFIQPDTIVPEPGDPQALNRYSYVLNNPLRYTDPTGMFSEDQLVEWFGSDWRDFFSDGWHAILLQANFGELISDGVAAYVFAGAGVNDGILSSGLVLWNPSTQEAAADVVSTLQGLDPGNVGLYRPTTSFRTTRLQGLEHEYHLYFGNAERSQQLALSRDWYRGLDYHVNVFEHWSLELGLDDVAALGALLWYGVKYGVRSAVGGPVGALALVVDISTWVNTEEVYAVESGSGFIYLEPLPAPGPRRDLPSRPQSPH